MKFLLRFILPLALILGVLGYVLLPLIDHLTTRWFVRDLDLRSKLVLNAIQEDLTPFLRNETLETRKKALHILKKTTQDERLLALGVCSSTDVLLLSMFAGASRELVEALIVNPYDADQSAMALHLALEMSTGEQRERMRALRAIVKEFNVYRWAGRMLLDAARVRRRNRFTKKLRKWETL